MGHQTQREQVEIVFSVLWENVTDSSDSGVGERQQIQHTAAAATAEAHINASHLSLNEDEQVM